MRTDRPDDGDSTPVRADVCEPAKATAPEANAPRPQQVAASEADGTEPPSADPQVGEPADAATRTERTFDHQASVDATYRAYAIDQAYGRVREIERDTVTPAMLRIQAEDPGRHLAGFENRLKERYRVEEKVNEAIEERGHSTEEALSSLKDVIRYTYCYTEADYTAGVYTDCDRIESSGFEPFDRRNSWAHDEYKGINTRWRVREGSQLFEVQFHTAASLAAKEETHGAYKQLRTLPEDEAEVDRLHAYQREVTAKVPIPPDALDIPDYP